MRAVSFSHFFGSTTLQSRISTRQFFLSNWHGMIIGLTTREKKFRHKNSDAAKKAFLLLPPMPKRAIYPFYLASMSCTEKFTSSSLETTNIPEKSIQSADTSSLMLLNYCTRSFRHSSINQQPNRNPRTIQLSP